MKRIYTKQISSKKEARLTFVNCTKKINSCFAQTACVTAEFSNDAIEGGWNEFVCANKIVNRIYHMKNLLIL